LKRALSGNPAPAAGAVVVESPAGLSVEALLPQATSKQVAAMHEKEAIDLVII
jgi:hypothetical protein